MKKITNYLFTVSQVRILSLASLLVCLFAGHSGKAQTVFSQDFSSSTTVTDYVSSSAPGATKFNAITPSSGTSTVTINSGMLQFVRANTSIGFTRTTNFDPVPSIAMVSFDIRVSNVANSSVSSVATFQVGSGFTANTSIESNTSTYAKFSLDLRTGLNFRFNDVSNSAVSSVLYPAGTTIRKVTWVMNNTGAAISYLAPNNTIETLPVDNCDIWVDNAIIFDDKAVQDATEAIQDFKFVYTGSTGTIALDNFLISNLVIPQVSSFSGNSVCSGGTGELTMTTSTGSGPYSLIYSDGTNRTITNVASGVAFSAAVPSTTTTTCTLVAVADVTGGIRTSGFTDSSATITVVAPTADAGADLAFCIGGTSAALGGSVGGTATGGTWSDGGVGGTFNSGATSLNTTWTPPSAYTGTATLTLTSSGGACGTATDSKTILVGAPTAVAAGADFTKTCVANTTGKVIGETAVAGFTYSWSPSTGLSAANVSNPTANPTTTTIYTVTKTTTATGCTSNDQIIVTVDNTAPTVSAGSAFTKTCVANTSGAQIGETAQSGYTYSWTGAGLSASNISNPIANPTVTTSYTVTKTNTATGCTATASVTVTVNNTLTVSAGTDFTKTCVTNPTGRAIGETNVSGNTYSWSPATGLSNANISQPTANPTTTTTYTVTKTNAANGCVVTDEVIVTVNLTTPVANAGADFTKTCVTNPNGLAIGEALQSGHTYSWSPTTGLSSSTASNPTANPTTTTTYTVTKTNTASGCTHTDQVVVTVNTTAPTVAALTGTQSICQGTTTTFASTTPNGVWVSSNPAVAPVSNGLINGLSGGTATISYTVTAANGCTTTVTRTVTVNPLPTTVVAGGTASICLGNSTGLTASAVIPYNPITTINSDNFNGTPVYTGGGTNAFAKKTNNSLVGTTQISNSIDASAYMMLSVQAFFNNPSVTGTLTSPVLNTAGFSSPLNFTYNHSYNRGNSGTRTAVVEVSTNGGTSWTTVKSYTENQGDSDTFVAETVNLDSYINQSNLVIRFSTTISASVLGNGWWAIDNVTLAGAKQLNALYSWTANTTAGINGLPSGAATPSVGNAAITVAPTANTTYTLVASDPLTGCTQTTTPVTVNVKPLPTATAPAAQVYCNGDVAPMTTLSGSPSGVTYDISGGAAIGLANATGLTEIPSFTATTGTATISITPQFNGCPGAVKTFSITVNPTPAVTVPVGQTYCEGVSVAALALTGSPSGVTYTISGGSVIGLADANNVTALPAFTPILGSATISITPKANGCTGATVTYTITVNPVLTPVFETVAPICSGASLSALPLTSVNGVTGTWSPALNNTLTTTYTFTPNSGQCFNPVLTTLTIVVNTNTVYYADNDGDGYGDASVSIETCLGQPQNYVTNNTDCAPGSATEWRLGDFYVDADNDTFFDGNPFATAQCYGNTTPTGYVSLSDNNGTDCDDTKFEINSNHVEVLGNGIDDNCDQAIDEVAPLSYLNPAYCGTTLNNIANSLFAYQIPSAQGYRFEISVNGANPRYYDSPINRFSLLNIPGGVLYNTTYTVRVAVKTNEFWRAYSTTCLVTTPAVPETTNVAPNQCGITLTDMARTIFAVQVTAANQYRFAVSDGVTERTYDSAVNRFSFAALGGLSYNTTYSVRVALRFGSTWQDYGTSCNITTPETPRTSNVIPSQCGTTISNGWTTVFAMQVAEATGYRFNVTAPGVSRVYDTPDNSFSLRDIASFTVTPNTTYTITVQILYNGFYQTAGSACTITTAGVVTRQAETAVSVFDVKAYPNPYADTFKLDMNTSGEDTVEVKVYDMIGRQMEATILNVSDLDTKEIGNQYPSGVYNIIVTQGENVKTLRVIKR